jgi:ABC-2 type transport system permease protein
MQIVNGPRLGLGETIGRLALTTAVTPFGLLWAAALGLLLTVLTDSPLAAAGGVVVVAIVSTTLDQVEALKDFRLWLPTHYAFAYQQLLLQPVDLRPVADTLVNGLLWVIVLGVLAAWRFHRKDITG